MGLFDKLLGARRVPDAAAAVEAKPAADASPSGHPEDRARATALVDEGNALEERGDLQAAENRYREALRVAPTLARAHLNVGNVFLSRGDFAAALDAYDTALRHEPGHRGAHFNRGNALAALGRLAEAATAYARAAEIDPGFVDAHIARGAVLDDLGRLDEAVASYRAALALQPNFPPALSNLGVTLAKLRRFDDAIDCQHRALAADPTLVQALVNLGNALKDTGRLDEAEAAYRRACEIEPGRLDARSNLLFCQAYREAASPAERRAEAERFGTVASRLATPFTRWRGTNDPDRPLRVGLVSGDLRDHPVGYFLDSTLAALAGSSAGRNVACIAYVTAPAPADDPVAARLRRNMQAWHEVAGLSDEGLARRIHADAIDILIDLSGHTGHTKLAAFAWKPAPVQVSWLGYFATTGLAAMDWFIADPWTLLPAMEPHFTERIWRLPETRLCFTPPEPSPPVARLPAAEVGHVTFGCFNHLAKMNDTVVEAWSRVLQGVPNSRLLLKSPPLESAAVRSAAIARFAAQGVGEARLELEGLSSRDAYLQTYARIDIALDPFPYPGGTTTVEALWMGVPVVTLAGHTFLSRQGAGLLHNAGLADWVAEDVDDYVRLAIRQAGDPPGLAQLRQVLRPQLQASPVMDAPRFARHFEAALRGMWRLACRPA